MGLGDRLKRLEGGKPPSCGSCPYERAPVWREVTRLVDPAGNEVGFEPDPNDPGDPVFCDSCPYQKAPEYARRVLVVEVASTRTVRAQELGP
jgi:hypothetical protein